MNKKLKVLIGTPIHQVKDYAMESWIQNVSKLKYTTNLFLVDNSPDIKYVEKVKSYCEKYGITNYKLVHINVDPDSILNEKLAKSREIIRQEILSQDYDIWFSWECDQIIPVNALDKLVALMEKGNYMMVCHGSPGRILPQENIAAFGVTLIKREALKKYSFLLASENWFKKQILQGGDSYIEIFGVIKPIYHLNE
mgnify:FL=1